MYMKSSIVDNANGKLCVWIKGRHRGMARLAFLFSSTVVIVFILVKDKPAYMRTATYSKLLNLATAARLDFGLEIPSILNNVEKVRF